MIAQTAQQRIKGMVVATPADITIPDSLRAALPRAEISSMLVEVLEQPELQHRQIEQMPVKKALRS
jgi:hypothetical protein